MSENQELRRSVLNQLESLHLAGVTHASVESFQEKKISAEKTLNADVKEPKVTMVNPVKDLADKTDKVGETRNSAQPGDRDASPGVVHGDPHEASNTTRNIKIEASWKTRLDGPFNAPYMVTLSSFLRTEKADGKRIYPPGSQIFRAFELTPFDTVKVVILGQDPYHGPGQAHGLSFSVASDVQPPPSLRNIYRELEADLGISHPGHGNLESWSRRGVLLLNACLTVEEGHAGSHQGKGWELFTDEVIRCLNDERENLVFILWGRKAQDKCAAIDRDRHHVITSVHPSPLSASNGFFGSKPFSQANAYLKETGQTPVDWNPN